MACYYREADNVHTAKGHRNSILNTGRIKQDHSKINKKYDGDLKQKLKLSSAENFTKDQNKKK